MRNQLVHEQDHTINIKQIDKIRDLWIHNKIQWICTTPLDTSTQQEQSNQQEKKTGASSTLKSTKTKSSRLQAENNHAVCKWLRESFKANHTNHKKITKFFSNPLITIQRGYQKYRWGRKPKKAIVQPYNKTDLIAELLFQNIFGFPFENSKLIRFGISKNV